MDLKLFTVLLSCFVLTHQAPINNDKCATECSKPTNFVFQVGKIYHYKFESKTKLQLDDTNEEVEIRGWAKIAPQSDCDFQLKLDDVQVVGVEDQTKYKKQLEASPLIFAFDDGRIGNVCPSDADEPWVANVKKAILSGLQVTPKSVGKYTVVKETDILGNCETTYSTSSLDSTKILKTKNLNKCTNRAHVRSFLIPSNFFNIGPKDKKTDYPTNNEYNCVQTLNADGIVREVKCYEKNLVNWRWLSKRKYQRETSLHIGLIKVVDGEAWTKFDAQKHIVDDLLFTRTTDHKVPVERVQSHLRSLCLAVESENNRESPKYFKQLTRSIRGLDYAQVSKLIEDVKRTHGVVVDGNTCKSNQLYGLLESALLMSGGQGGVEYFTRETATTGFDSKRWWTLLSLPLLPDPNEDMVKAVLPLLQADVHPNINLMATSLIGNHVRTRKHCPSKSKPIADAIDILVAKIPDQCKSSQESEVIGYLQALGNIRFINRNGKKRLVDCVNNVELSDRVRVAAIETLRKTRSYAHNRQDVLELIDNLFKKNNENNEVRISAVRLLMECGKFGDQKIVAKKAVDLLTSSKDDKMTNYLLSYLKNIKQSNRPDSLELASNIDIPAGLEVKSGKYSRNFRFAKYIDSIGAGIDANVDVVYNLESKYPKQVGIHVNVPTEDQSIDLVEFQIRQESDEQHIESVVKEIQNIFGEDNIRHVLEHLKNIAMNKMGYQADYQEHDMHLYEKLKQVLSSIDSLDWSLSINGNMLISYRGAKANEVRNKRHTNMDMTELEDELKRLPGGFGFMLLDSTMDIPTVSGLPIRLCATATLVSGTQFLASTTDENDQSTTFSIWPNFAIDLTLGVSTSIGCYERFGFKHKTLISSDFGVKTKVSTTDDGMTQYDLYLPRKQANFVQFTSGFYSTSGNNAKMLVLHDSELTECSNLKYTGFSVCYHAAVDRYSELLDSYWNIAAYIKPTTNDITGWRKVFSFGAVDKPYYLKIVRMGEPSETLIEIKVEPSKTVANAAAFNIKCPKAVIDGTVQAILTPVKFLFELDYKVNDKRRLILLSHKMEKSTENSSDYASKIRLDLPFLPKPYGLDASFSFGNDDQTDSKVQLFNCKISCVNVVKGTKIKVFTADLAQREQTDKTLYESNLQIGNVKLAKYIKIKNNVIVGKGNNDLYSIDKTIEYRNGREMSKAETVKFVAKYLDQDSSEDTKLHKKQFVHEVTFTQFPALNYHLSYNFLYKRRNHCENEVLIKWGPTFDSDEQKIRLFHTSTIGQSDEKRTWNTKFNVVIGPLGANYNIEMGSNKMKIEDKKHYAFTIEDVNNPANLYQLKFDVGPTGAKLDEAVVTWDVQLKYPSGSNRLLITIKVDDKEAWDLVALASSTAESKDDEWEYEVSGRWPKTRGSKAVEANLKIKDMKTKNVVGKITYYNQVRVKFQTTIDFGGEQVFNIKLIKDKINRTDKFVFYLLGFDLKMDMYEKPTREYGFTLIGNCKSHHIHHQTELKGTDDEITMTSSGLMEDLSLWKFNYINIRKDKMTKSTLKFGDVIFTLHTQREANDDRVLNYNMQVPIRNINHELKYVTNDKAAKTTLSTKFVQDSVVKASVNLVYEKTLKTLKIAIPESFSVEVDTVKGYNFEFSNPRYVHNMRLQSENSLTTFETMSKQLKYGDERLLFRLAATLNVKEDPEWALNVRMTCPHRDLFTEVGFDKKTGNKFSMRLEKRGDDSKFTLDQVRRSRRAAGDDKVWNFKVEDQEVNLLLKTKSGKLELKASGNLNKPHKLAFDCKPMELAGELSYSAGDVRKVQGELKRKDKILLKLDYTRDANKIYGTFESWKRTGSFDISDYRGLPKVNVEYTTKISGVKRSLKTTSKKVGNEIVHDVEIKPNVEEKPDMVYTGTLTTPVDTTEKYWVKYNSVWPNGCKTNYYGEIKKDAVRSSKYTGEITCKDGKKTMSYERNKVDNKYLMKLLVKSDENAMIDASMIVERTEGANRTLSVELTTMSTAIPVLDGIMVDLKRGKGLGYYDMSLYVQLPFIRREYRLNVNADLSKGIKWTLIAVRPTLWSFKLSQVITQGPGVYEMHLDLNKLDGPRDQWTEVPLVTNVVKLNREEVILSTECVPGDSKLMFSMKEGEKLGEMSVLVKLMKVTHIQFDHKMTGSYRQPERTHDITAKLFGFPITCKVDVDNVGRKVKLSIKPVDKTYPYQNPHERRFLNCYEDDNEDCLNIETNRPHALGSVNLVKMNAKINRRGKFGRKHDVSMKFTNDRENAADEEFKHTLLMTMDKEQMSYDGEHKPLSRWHELRVNDRIFRAERNYAKAEDADGVEYTINLWSDYKNKKDQKMTIHRVIKTKPKGETRTTTVTHPVFKKPIKITFDYERNPIIATMSIDFSDDPNENLHTTFTLDGGEADGDLVTKKVRKISIYRHDKKAMYEMDDGFLMRRYNDGKKLWDFSVHGIRKWSTDKVNGIGSNVFDISMSKPAEYRDYTYKWVMQRLNDYATMYGYAHVYPEGLVQENLTLGLSMNAGQRFVSNMTWGVPGEKACYHLTTYEVPETSGNRKYVHACWDTKNTGYEPFATLLVTEDGESKPVADFNIKRKEGPGRMYILTMKWNPDAAGDILIDIVQKIDEIDTRRTNSIKEIKKQMKQVQSLLMQPFGEKVCRPFVNHARKEWKEFVKSNPNIFSGQSSSVDSNEVRSISKRASGSDSAAATIAEAIKGLLNFKYIKNNPDDGEVVVEFGWKYF